jgi:hypothetical protein
MKERHLVCCSLKGAQVPFSVISIFSCSGFVPSLCDPHTIHSTPVLQPRYGFCTVSASSLPQPTTFRLQNSISGHSRSSLVIFGHLGGRAGWPSAPFARPRCCSCRSTVAKFQNLVKFGKVLVNFWSSFQALRPTLRTAVRGDYPSLTAGNGPSSFSAQELSAFVPELWFGDFC